MHVSRRERIAAVLAALVLVFICFFVFRSSPGVFAARSRTGGAARSRTGEAARSPVGVDAARPQAFSSLLARLRTLPSAPRGYSGDVPKARQVLLSNRRVEIRRGRAFPKRFSGLQTPSARGTVPYVVVCAEPVSDVTRAVAAASGAKVVGFLPANAMLVECTEKSLALLASDAAFVAAFEFEPMDKVQPGLVAALESAGGQGSGAVTILTFDSADVPAVAAAVKAAGGVVTATEAGGRGFVRANLAAAALAALAVRGDVHWMEKFSLPRALNDVAVGAGLMDVTPVWDPHGLTGQGQTIATADSGIDTGLTQTLVPDFTGRVVRIVKFNTRVTDDSGTTYTFSHTEDLLGHGTHTAGSLAGSGAMSAGQFKGAAYAAKLFVECGGEDGGGNILYFVDTPSAQDCYLLYQRSQYKYYIHSDSWGSSAAGAYDSGCVNLDTVIWSNPDLLPVFAAGNTGSSPNTIGSPAAAKNCLTVGASENLRTDKGSSADNAAQIASFSSRGPCADGRIKPDIVTPGTYVVSVRSTKSSNTGWGVYAANTNYLYDSGTSMATPLAAGACALARQWLVERRGYSNSVPPTAALLKAVMMGGAQDLYGLSGSNVGSAAPNNNQGWGRVDLEQTLFPSNRAVRLVDRIPFSSGFCTNYVITTTNAAALDVQLVWIDYPATAGAASALVNDLDLVVSNRTTGVVCLGNGGTSADALNNAESVRITNAPAATYDVFVKGTTVPYPSTSGGAAAIYVRGAFAADTNVIGSVDLVVATDSGHPGTVSPDFGTNRVDRDLVLTLSAGDFVTTNEYGESIARCRCTGWTGTGNIPASGSTNWVSVTFTTNSAITWHWTSEVSDYMLSRWTVLPQYDVNVNEVLRDWVAVGTPVTLGVPASSPAGSETIDLTGYPDDASSLGVCRLGDVLLLDANTYSGLYLFDDVGRLASSVTFPMTNSSAVYFEYYNVTNVYAATNSAYAGLPEWWYMRYLFGATDGTTNGYAAVDADGDGFTNYQEWLADTDPVDPGSFFAIFGFCPTNILWKGGVERTQVVERAGLLSTNAAAWTGVYTNYPATPVTNSLALPFQAATNSFYRIRAL